MCGRSESGEKLTHYTGGGSSQSRKSRTRGTETRSWAWSPSAPARMSAESDPDHPAGHAFQHHASGHRVVRTFVAGEHVDVGAIPAKFSIAVFGKPPAERGDHHARVKACFELK